MDMTPRQLIPDDRIIVILDTSPVRELAFTKTKPPWVQTFSEMSRDGYSFSLADTTAAELMNQVQAGATELDSHLQAMDWASTFLNAEIPVLPGKMDLEGMLGLNADWDSDVVRNLALEMWDLLGTPLEPVPMFRPSFEILLEEERCEWESYFVRMRKVSKRLRLDISEVKEAKAIDSLLPLVAQQWDQDTESSPPASIRRHLELRYRLRQFVRTERTKEPYNPAARKNRNDGIDVDLYTYFMLPALVVASDSGFYGSLQDIESFQKAWFMSPELLASEWSGGNRPQPSWPGWSIAEEEEN